MDQNQFREKFLRFFVISLFAYGFFGFMAGYINAYGTILMHYFSNDEFDFKSFFIADVISLIFSLFISQGFSMLVLSLELTFEKKVADESSKIPLKLVNKDLIVKFFYSFKPLFIYYGQVGRYLFFKKLPDRDVFIW